MSRRPQQPDRSEQNRATLKQLVKLEPNKTCADCKRNKHPRWASWNLGVFVCIRCSGIHRSLGVHISRVKSVDLDTWTEEQMASILRWGNARANKYWEAKLAPGHVPNEAKIENFIRTKYDSKRWVMDGPMPDPATLDEEGADDDVPLNVVQEKARVERTASVRNGSSGAQARAPAVDLFGDEPAAVAPVRPSTTEPATGRLPAAKAAAAPARQTKPGEGLLGLDFFGSTSATPSRPASATSAAGAGAGAGGRVDLKNSILSLYASAPKATTPAAQPNAQDSFGGPTASKSNSTALGDLGDAFGGLTFSSSSSPQLPKATPLSNATSPAPVQARPSSVLSGGSFFDSKPAPPAKPTSPPSQLKQNDSFGDFGGFESSSSSSKPTASARSPAATKSSSSAMGDLFDLSTPAQPTVQPSKQPPPISASNYASAAAFNLSQPKTTPAPVQSQTQASSFSNMSNMDAWGSNDAWSTPDPAPVIATTTSAAPMQASSSTVKTTTTVPAVTTSSGGWGDTGGWGEPDPTPVKPATSTTGMSSGTNFTVQQDEEFGGWSHASPVATTNNNTKPSGLGGGTSDDLFGNVWG